jgi:thymidylate kinase
MLRIIEGTDGTGKSTYAKFVHGRVGGVLLHWGPPDDDPLLMYVGRVVRWIHDASEVTCDRSSFGSLVWSSLGFHRPTMSTEVLAAVCRTYATLGAIATVLVRPPEHIGATLADRGETNEQIENALRGQDAYLRMMVRREILYIPTSLTSSDWAHYEQENHQ